MGIWSNPVNKAWRRIPQPVRTGIGVGAGVLGAATGIGAVGGALAGFGYLGAGSLAVSAAGYGASAAVPAGLLGMYASTQAYNTRRAEEQARWERQTYREQMAREDNAMQRRMADLKAAGLNPALAYSLGGAGSSAAGHEYTAPQMSMDGMSQALGVIQQREQIGLNRQMVEAQTGKLEQESFSLQLKNLKDAAEMSFEIDDFAKKWSGKARTRQQDIDIKDKIIESYKFKLENMDSVTQLNRLESMIRTGAFINEQERVGIQIQRDLLSYGLEMRDAEVLVAANLMKQYPNGVMPIQIKMFMSGDPRLDPRLKEVFELARSRGLMPERAK